MGGRCNDVELLQLKLLKQPLLDANEDTSDDLDAAGDTRKQGNGGCPLSNISLVTSAEGVHQAVGVVKIVCWLLVVVVLLLGVGLSAGVWIATDKTWNELYLTDDNAYPAMVFLTGALPPGLLLLGAIMHVLDRRTSGCIRIGIFSTMTASWIAVLIVSLAYIPYDCSADFDASIVLTFYKGHQGKVFPEYKFGSSPNPLKVIWALTAAVVSICYIIFSALPLIKIANRWCNQYLHNKKKLHSSDGGDIPGRHSLEQQVQWGKREKRRDQAAVFFLLVLYLPTCFFLTTWLPNIWNYFMPETIAYGMVAPAVNAW